MGLVTEGIDQALATLWELRFDLRCKAHEILSSIDGDGRRGYRDTQVVYWPKAFVPTTAAGLPDRSAIDIANEVEMDSSYYEVYA